MPEQRDGTIEVRPHGGSGRISREPDPPERQFAMALLPAGKLHGADLDTVRKRCGSSAIAACAAAGMGKAEQAKPGRVPAGPAEDPAIVFVRSHRRSYNEHRRER
jgi:hypothetical protein